MGMGYGDRLLRILLPSPRLDVGDPPTVAGVFAHAVHAQDTAAPKLAVAISIDQLRMDVLERYAPAFARLFA